MLVRGCLLILAFTMGFRMALAQVCNYAWKPEIGQPGIDWANATYDAVRWDPDGAGPQLERIVVCGSFGHAGGQPAVSIAAWNPATGEWSEVGGGLYRNGGWADVRALAVLPDNSLVAGGLIHDAGGVPVSGIAKFDGSAWSPLGAGLGGAIRDMLVLPNGHLVVAGDRVKTASAPGSSGVLAWDGASWYSLLSPLDFNGSEVRKLQPTAEGGFLATGSFFSWTNPNLSCIARWSPSAQPAGVWSDVGGGMPSSYGVNGAVELDDGDVVVCGDLRYDGGQIYHVAKWAGAGWERMDTGIDRRPSAIALLPNGGMFIGTGWAGGVYGGCSSLCHLYDWTGTEWEIEAWVCSNWIGAIDVLSDGDVVLTGVFSQFNDYLFNAQGQVIGGTILNVGNVMRLEPGKPQITLDPQSLSGLSMGPHTFEVAAVGAAGFQWQRRSSAGVWLDLGDGVNTDPSTGLTLTAAGTATDELVLTAIDLGSGAPSMELRARADDGCGFDFSAAAELTIECTATSYCTAKVSSNGCTPSISGSGSASLASPASFSATTTGMETTVSAVDLFGATGQSSLPFQGGVLCVASPIYRLPGKNSGGTGTCGGSISYTLSDVLAAPGGGSSVVAGSVVYLQTWSRDPGDAFKSSLSDALQVQVCP
jgi:hypothetical protein